MQNKKIIAFLAFAVLSVFSAVSAGAATREYAVSEIVTSSNIDSDAYNDSAPEILASFKDGNVFEKEWRKPYVSAAIDCNIIQGYEDGTLRLCEKVTRAEFACMLYRAKDFFDTAPIDKPAVYGGRYTDLSDWNEKEIVYCMENGLMIGYGDSFGSSDIVTKEQIETVKNRLIYGLSVKEKYLLYDICGMSPISMEEVLNSANDESLCVVQPNIGGMLQLEGSSSTAISEKLEALLETAGNMDFEKLENEEYRSLISGKFKGKGYSGNKTDIVIRIVGGGTQTLEDKISEASEQKIKRESIVVLSPVSNWQAYLFPAYRKTAGVGYEYYCYSDTGYIPPNGEEIGVWYRRTAEAVLTEYLTYSSQYAEMECRFGVPEKV